MIVYEFGAYGWRLLLRLHGSATVAALVPAVLSTAFLFFFEWIWGRYDQEDKRPISNPYAIGALIAAYTYLITFRATHAYNRYWEAAGAIYMMKTKWIEFGTALAAFHYQSQKFDGHRPPAFGANPNSFKGTRDRERNFAKSDSEFIQIVVEMANAEEEAEKLNRTKLQKLRRRFQRKNTTTTTKKSDHSLDTRSTADLPRKNLNASKIDKRIAAKLIPVPAERGTQRISMSPNKLENLKLFKTQRHLERGLERETPEPSLFLQEAAHLLSLLSAVAMSTLRNDIEGSEAPLCEYVPGSPWPPVDPDELSGEIRKEYYESNRFMTVIRYLLGTSRSETRQTLYNAARPFAVLGNISDVECELLQAARGPEAKVRLCTMWVQEFLSREYMSGSTGNVAPPIISRLYQLISDGALGYAQARKVATIPFPFPNAQLTALFINVVGALLPILMYSYVSDMTIAALLNFFTVLGLTGLHEVAKELEEPFKNTPNDLPLTTFQAEMNEALIVIYAGFHPDAWWTFVEEEPEKDKKRRVKFRFW